LRTEIEELLVQFNSLVASIVAARLVVNELSFGKGQSLNFRERLRGDSIVGGWGAGDIVGVDEKGVEMDLLHRRWFIGNSLLSHFWEDVID